MRETLQLVAITVVLTVLIWVYADRAGFEEHTLDVTFVIETLPEYVPSIVGIESKPRNSIPISVTVRGPKSSIQRLRADNDNTCRVRISEQFSTGEVYRLDVGARLREWDRIRLKALEIVSTSKDVVEYTVDRYETRSVELVTNSGVHSDTLAAKPVITPPTVEVTMLESEWAALPNPQEPIALNIIEELNARASEREFTLTTTLPTKWQNVTPRIEPNQVEIRVRRRFEATSVRFAPIRLEVKAPIGFLDGGFYIEPVDETGTRAYAIQDVEVLVPAGREGQLEAQDIEAFIKINEEDIPSTPIAPVSTAPASEAPLTKPVQFRLPVGFEDHSLVPQEHTVKLFIRKHVPVAETELVE